MILYCNLSALISEGKEMVTGAIVNNRSDIDCCFRDSRLTGGLQITLHRINLLTHYENNTSVQGFWVQCDYCFLNNFIKKECTIFISSNSTDVQFQKKKFLHERSINES